MYLESKEIIDRPCDEVYELVRDHLVKVAPYLPNIDKVEQVTHQHSADCKNTVILNHWTAKVVVPEVAMKFIKKELFSWKDNAVWDNEKRVVNYQLESFWSKDIFVAKGANYFTATADKKTELRITCEVTLNPDKVPGVPGFLVKKVLPMIEDMVKAVLEPNLMGLAKGIRSYFDHAQK
ncbi:MAG: SRPBCC family protein [Oligoflexia bacterium]|nr:SRPBCC family protein [Oligoflexia bacterium]MBF0365155.1 SRPBCC family protein [Oligoflexia bacterium]